MKRKLSIERLKGFDGQEIQSAILCWKRLCDNSPVKNGLSVSAIMEILRKLEIPHSRKTHHNWIKLGVIDAPVHCGNEAFHYWETLSQIIYAKILIAVCKWDVKRLAQVSNHNYHWEMVCWDFSPVGMFGKCFSRNKKLRR